ncbi:MAG: TIR domain-containing protein, partial [Thermoanaerobaculia bacterium]
SYAFEERVVNERPAGAEPAGDGPSPITAAFERLAQAIARLAAPGTALAAAVEPGAVRQAPAEPRYDLTRKFGGYDAFLSYHQEDRETVASIARRLKEGGLVPFLDQWEIVPGAAWQERMEEALFESRACLLFVGSSGLGPWEQGELRAILERRLQEPDFRVVPVLLPGAPPEAARQLPPLLASLAWVDFREGLDDEYAFGRLLAGLRGTAPGPGKTVVVHGNPYPGLQSFREQDAAFFFGRQGQIEALLGKLRDGARLLAVTGPSGAGKCSLVRAGLFPALRGGALPGSELWPLVELRPGADPLAALAGTLERLHRDLAAGPGLPSRWQPAEGGAGVAARIREVLGPEGGEEDGAERPERRLLLFVDHFEELFTRSPEAQRRPFLDSLLAALAEPRSPLRVVVAVREDFLTACDAYPELPALLERGRVRVMPLTREEMRQAIEQPAQRAGFAFEVGLAERILDDVSGVPGALPLLQFLLAELWERRRGGWLTAAAYEEIGGVRGVVARQAETLYRGLQATDQEIARRILLRLIYSAEATGETGRRATLAELWALHGDAARVERVVEVLAEAGLVTVGQAGAELAHETLIRSWPRAQVWIRDDAQFLRWREQLRAAVDEWQRSGGEADLLLRGAPLATAEVFLRERSGDLTVEETAFIAAAVELRGREEKRRRQRTRAVAAGAAILLIGAIAVTVVVQTLRGRSTTALSRQLAAQSTSALEDDLSLALLLGVEALEASDTPEARKSLLDALDYGANVRAEFRHQGIVESVALSPDGQLLASGSDDGSLFLQEVATGRALSLLPASRRGEIDGLTFSHDGKLLAAGRGNEILLWDVTTRKLLGTLP